MKSKFLAAIIISFSISFIAWEMPSPSKLIAPATCNPALTPDNPWAGTYRGTLPSAMGEGYKTELTLNSNKTYDLIVRFLGKREDVQVYSDKFSINKEGTMITLGGIKEMEQPTKYLIGENTLTQLTKSGERVGGDLEKWYVLQKGAPSIEEKYWKLIVLHGMEVTPEPGNRKEANIMLKASGNRLTGSGGCNTFSGNYVLTGDSGIAFQKVIATQMECPSMETEPRFIKVLQLVDQYKINGDTLLLSSGKNPPSAKLIAIYKK